MGWSAESPAQLSRAHTLDLPSPPWSKCSYFLLKGNLHSIKHPQVLKSALLASQALFTDEASLPLGSDCIVPCTSSDELWGPHHDCSQGTESRVVIICLGQGWSPVMLFPLPTPPLDAADVTNTSGSGSHTHVCTSDLPSQYPPPSLKVEVHV